MSDANANDQQQNDDDAQGDDNLAQLRKAAKEGKSAVSENEQLKRKIALLETGIDTSTPLGKFFATNYSGELTVEAITAAATELGLTPGDGAGQGEQQQEDPAADQHRQAQQTRDVLSGGGAGALAVDLESDLGRHPVHGALEDFHRDKGTMGEERAMLRAFDEVIVAGIKGDSRAIFDEAAHYEAAEEYGRATGSQV